MRRLIITLCCLLATLPASSPPALAQDLDAPPEPAATLAAFNAIQNWVREWNVTEDNAPSRSIPSCTAASITLRLSGETVARGVAVASSESERASVIAKAARAALAEAEPKLGVPRDALYQQTLLDLARQLTISLQLAGTLIPVAITDAKEAAAAIAPGLEGAAVRLGNRTDVMFPERMLTMGTEPGAALASLVARLAEDPSLAVVPLGKLAKDRGAVYYRFKVSHVAAPRPFDAPRFFNRGGTVVRTQELDTALLKKWADLLASGIARSADERFPSTSGHYDPFRSSTAEGPRDAQVLLNALALARYAQMPHLDAELKEVASSVSRELVERVLSAKDGVVLADGETERSTLLHLWSVSGVPLRDATNDTAWLDRFIAPARSMIVKRSSDIDAHKNPAAIGLLAAAMADGMDAQQQADELTRRALVHIPPGMLVSAMPFLGWAELQLHPVNKGEVPSAVALREMRDQLWQHQLRPESLPPDQQDLAGGVVFSAGSSPMPTWQLARPLTFVATMLGDPRLTPDHEVSEQVLKLLASLRFLHQLTARESEVFMYRNPELTIGRVRSSLWDHRMPPEATAMTLLAVCETLRSLEAIQARQAAQPPK